MPPPLLNYTTKIPAAQSFAEIVAMVHSHGAKRVLSDYGDDGEPEAISFAIETSSGLRTFRLPAEPYRCLAVMLKNREIYKTSHQKTPDLAQAQRVAWRIIRDWLASQLALIQTGMVSLPQVMLPYLVVTPEGGTLYEELEGGRYALPAEASA